MGRVWFTKYQWNFYRGWSNEFDLVRVGVEWVDYHTAKAVIIVVGFKLAVDFPAMNFNDSRRRFLAWWKPCSDCGGRFGKHDESKEHLPF